MLTTFKISALRGMPVISLAEGLNVGTVKDFSFDSANLRVTALMLTTSGGQSIVPFSKIRSIGADAVTIESIAATEGGAGQSDIVGLRPLSQLTGLPVAGSDGTHLGEVYDLGIAPEDGRLTELVIHKGGFLGIGGSSVNVPASAIRSIGPNLVTVDMDVADAKST